MCGPSTKPPPDPTSQIAPIACSFHAIWETDNAHAETAGDEGPWAAQIRQEKESL